MKQLVLAVIFVLILITSLVKNSTKEIEDQIFAINENIRPLKSELEDVLLEFNYLSSPEKLVQYQTQYFEKGLIKIEIMNIKEIIEITKNTKKIKAILLNSTFKLVLLFLYENSFSYSSKIIFFLLFIAILAD